MTGQAKRFFESVLAHAGRLGIGDRKVRLGTLIVAYHNIVLDDDPPDGDLPLHLPLQTFREHLDVLEELCDVVSLNDLSARSLRRRVIITFDDAYRGAVRYALPELAKRGLPSVVFVAPAYLEDGTFWWDDAARALGRALPTELRLQALETWRGREDEIRHAVPGMGAASTAAPSALRCCSLAELRAAVREGPVLLGSHTWTHPNLTRLNHLELEAELAQPLEWLRSEFPEAGIPFLTYPYGLVSGEVRSATIAAGYEGALLVMGGWTSHDDDRFAIPRKNVPAGLSADGLAARLTGILPP